jgi:transcriptional regulator with AAA-type ATPase domain/polyferredoxin
VGSESPESAQQHTPSKRLAEAVRQAVPPTQVAAGETVVRQGDEGRKLYLVHSGALDVVVTAEEGLRLPVARLGPGTHFGEMSLLAGMPVSADVVACEPSILYAVTAEQFDELVREDRALMEYLAEELAVRLKRTNEQLSALQQRQTALSRLIGAPHAQPFRSDLPSFGKKLQAAVQEACRADGPLLIVGEDGVGKRGLAQHIHSMSNRRERPVLVVDCAEIPADEATAQLFGGAQPDAVARFADSLGYIQAADGGTLVLANIERLPADAHHNVATFLRTHAGAEAEFCVSVRVIATSCLSPADLAGNEAIDEQLKAALAGAPAIELLALRNRRRDIIPLAEHFLATTARRTGAEPRQLSDSARRELLGYDFPFGNARELRQVMELACQLAEGDTIRPEHLFFGPGGGPEAAQLDLLRWPWLERVLLDGRLLSGLKLLVGLVFGAMVIASLAAPDSVAARAANLMVWGIWWPALIVSLLLLGRAWCAVCPLSSSAQVVQRAWGRQLALPDWLKEFGPIFGLVGFVGIVWVEQVTGMADKPLYTACLLVSLAVAAIFIGWLFQRHAWCRYLCPLGAMGAVFSVASALRVQARREVCGASCTGHECYRGGEKGDGCPMFSHALFLSSGQHCKLCMECLRSCPSQSPRLILQPPLRDIWRSNLITADMAPLTVVVGLLALFLAATPIIRPESRPGGLWFTIGALAAIGVGLALTRLFQHRQQTAGSRDVSWTARAVYAYAPAAAALLLAFHLRALPWLERVAVRVTTAEGVAVGASILQLAQWAAALAGGLMTGWALWWLCSGRFGPGPLKPLIVWIALGLLAAVGLVEGLILLS